MAVPTKGSIQVQASASNLDAQTTTSAGQDITTDFGAFLTARIQNGATAPTTPCNFRVEYSRDNTDYYNPGVEYQGPSGNNGLSEFSVRIPPEVRFYRTVFTGNTGQAVTVEAEASVITDIS